MKKNPTKKFLTGLVSILIIFTQSQPVFASFSDVFQNNPQAEAIMVLQHRKVITGYPDGTFKPDKLINRAEFLKMAFNDMGYRATAIADKTAFTDVPGDNWIAPYVKKALEISVISASGTNPLFSPGNPITRVEAMKIAFPISGISTPYYTDIDPAELFQDVSPRAWYAYLARAAKLHGIVSLKRPELFWAKHLMTRGDAAELIYELQLAREDQGIYISVDPTVTVDGIDQTSMDLLNNPKFAILLDVWKKANTDFYNKANVNQDELVYGAIKGLVERLGDQYTVFEEPSDALGLQEYLQGEFEGIGTVIDIIDGNIVIMKTLPASPAEKAGLQTGDSIKKINGQAVDTLTINQVLNLIRGQAGTSVTLTIQRSSQTLEVTLVRAKITFSSISEKMIGGIGYVSVTEFTDSSPLDFTNALTNLGTSSPKGYILDLRGNPGGYLESSIKMLGHFVENGKTVVTTKSAEGATREFKTEGAAELKGKPLIVLVDDGSASAAEIMAGALQDLNLGKLLGTKTYGKGSVQEITNYTDDSLLKISIAHWLTPNGRDINGIGLTPDIIVELDQQQLLNGKDNQLQRALDILNM